MPLDSFVNLLLVLLTLRVFIILAFVIDDVVKFLVKLNEVLAPEEVPYRHEQDAGHLEVDVAVHHPVRDSES